MVEVTSHTGVRLAAKFPRQVSGAHDDLALESRLLQRCVHPCIVSCFGLTSEKEKVCLLLELGTNNLWDWLAGQTDMNVQERWQLVAQASSGLAFLHEQQVLHCDVKPGNIIIGCQAGGSLVAKLGDFGLAKEMDSTGQVNVHPKSVYSWPYRPVVA